MHPKSQVDFSNTAIAFASKNQSQLRKSYWLFKLMNSKVLVDLSIQMANLSLKLNLPTKGIIKNTIFAQFCGGETINECEKTIALLNKFGIGTILDYSVEGQDSESNFENVMEEIIATIKKAAENTAIPFSVFKVTGIVSFDLLEKVNNKEMLSYAEEASWEKAERRLNSILEAAATYQQPIFIDAEESWIQDAIDQLVENKMPLLNKEKAIVYNTVQMYRHDRLGYLAQQIENAKAGGYKLGVKIVRGAYMEKERDRAEKLDYASPIQPSKAATDADFDAAIALCMDNLDHVAFVSGTHNEESCHKLIALMKDKGVQANDSKVYFSQLLGMSDNLSFNLSKQGYNVAKYVPYGPVYEVLPYLIRRAQENTSIAGQMSREFKLITSEIKRRKSNR